MIKTVISFPCKKDEQALKCWFPLVLGKHWIAKALLAYQLINSMEELLGFLKVVSSHIRVVNTKNMT